MQTPAFVWQW